ncbi:MAG: lipoyl synthase [bacterium]|nr:lipoyl synthase [bacterium]
MPGSPRRVGHEDNPATARRSITPAATCRYEVWSFIVNTPDEKDGEMSAKRKEQRRPDWLKVRLSTGGEYREMKQLLGDHALNTVCQEANCPNLHECWNAGTATFLILGDICTRNCGFCGITKGRPGAADEAEPLRVAKAVRALKCRHAVLTSVTRDDLPDLGSGIWAETIREIRRLNPQTTCEALIPDLLGEHAALIRVLEARPAVLAHNVETVPELYDRARRDSDFQRSLAVLRHAADHRNKYGIRVKSGMMLGLGETREQLLAVMERLLEHGCEILTLGQYLPPGKGHMPVERYVTPEEFDELKAIGEEMGFRHVEAGPFVRSSYRAADHLDV